jgi:hypothetical protein
VPVAFKYRLESHYEHLYPSGTIIDEQGLISDLPIQLRAEICAVLYAKLLSRVSFLVRGLSHDAEYMVELSMLLSPESALANTLVVAEQTEADAAFFIEQGRCRVTQQTQFHSDTERLRHWVQQVFHNAGVSVSKTGVGNGLYLPSRESQFRKLRRLHQQACAEAKNRPSSVPYLQLWGVWGKHSAKGNQPTLAWVLAEARAEGFADFGGSLPDDTPTEANPGPAITLRDDQGRMMRTDLELFCGALRTGEVLCELINILDVGGRTIKIWEPSMTEIALQLSGLNQVANAGNVVGSALEDAVSAVDENGVRTGTLVSKTGLSAITGLAASAVQTTTGAFSTGGYITNVEAFCDAVTSAPPTSCIHVPADQCFEPEQLLGFNEGGRAARQAKQQAVVATLLVLAEQVTRFVNSTVVELDNDGPRVVII